MSLPYRGRRGVYWLHQNGETRVLTTSQPKVSAALTLLQQPRSARATRGGTTLAMRSYMHNRLRQARLTEGFGASVTGLVIAYLCAACAPDGSSSANDTTSERTVDSATDEEDTTSDVTTEADAGSDVEGDTSGATTEQQPPVVLEPIGVNDNWFKENTVSLRVGLPRPGRGAILNAEALAAQLEGYDPGSLIRCAVGDYSAYQAAIDALGGVRWGYTVGTLEDQSKPRLYAGYQRRADPAPQSASGSDGAGGAIEIALPDVVAVTESAALYYSAVHGLLLVSFEDGTPRFECATQLPGYVDRFFYHQGQLVAMTKAYGAGGSALLHFNFTGSELQFVESRSLGNVSILDSRRFNDRLVFYTDMPIEAQAAQTPSAPANGLGGLQLPQVVQRSHRALHVYRLGEVLEPETFDTLINTSVPEDQLFDAVTSDTQANTVVHEAQAYGSDLWASDRYFVVTEQLDKTLFDYWKTHTYSVCTAGHTVETPYEFCSTEYETRPNPNYVEPDNSGGDRSCNGVTLSECLVQVAKVANKTIRVPVATTCETRMHKDFICDAHEQRTAEYPVFKHERSTRLYIYEYTDEGFIQVDTQVHEIEAGDLEQAAPSDTVDSITTSPETFDLAVPGFVQTLYFQNGYLYVISEGVLQVYAMGGSSIVRTSTLDVVRDSLQSSLFTTNQLFLSDFGYTAGQDHSTLRVIDLSNPAFPQVEAATHELPGGHRSIFATSQGIFTVGAVNSFMGEAINALKLGLFANPYATETAYLILGTDLAQTQLGAADNQLFDAPAGRLLLPYSGTLLGPDASTVDDEQVFRVGVSRLEPSHIQTEGAIVAPEPVERVRRVVSESNEATYLSFAPNSIEWLTPKDAEWQTTPVLEYMVPLFVYRLNDNDDYVEFQQLGSRCRLYFANANDINQRANGNYSQEFECKEMQAAYSNTLLFQHGTVEFGADGSIRLLSDDEATHVRELIAQRPVCVLSDMLVDNIYVNPNEAHDQTMVTCMSYPDYARRSEELNNP